MNGTDAAGQAVDAREPTTLANDAYLRLREDIISGMFSPGEPLRLEALKARYGYSFSPLREALNRLRSERLVELSALKGFRMAPFSREEMWDAIETRIYIESQALCLSIQNGGVDWEAGVVAAFHSLSRSTEEALVADRPNDASREIERRHHAFHSALICASRSRWLSEFAEQLYSQTERYRRPMLKATDPALNQRDIVAEHKAIMQAALARDPDKARELLSEHYRRTGKLLEQRLTGGPDPMQRANESSASETRKARKSRSS